MQYDAMIHTAIITIIICTPLGLFIIFATMGIGKNVGRQKEFDDPVKPVKSKASKS